METWGSSVTYFPKEQSLHWNTALQNIFAAGNNTTSHRKANQQRKQGRRTKSAQNPKTDTHIAVQEQKCCFVSDSYGAKDISGTATPQVQLNSWHEPGVQPQHLKTSLTQTDKHPLQGLIGGGLQVEE